MTAWLEVGSPAKAFRLPSTGGQSVALSDYAGRPVVLYFYPRDNTPGCTKQACAFRDHSEEFARRGAVVLGVSPDSLESHEKFRERFELNFPLLADGDHRVSEAYGAWREKNLYGKKSLGIQRSTFLIDAQGKIAKLWKRVRVAGHEQQVLEALDALG